jgi:cytochrome c-type protein NapB
MNRVGPLLAAIFGFFLLSSGSALAQQDAPRLTGPDPMPGSVPAPQLAEPETDIGRHMRNYPEQPPVIPHDIDGYQLTLSSNTCLTCHKRQYIEESGAPMVSVTHYQDRDGQMLGDVAPRRYFCTQCHVPQTRARPLVVNGFTDMLDLVREGR